MPRRPQDVTDAELAILQHLWEHGPATVRDIAAALYPKGTGSDLATVQQLLRRLEQKRCVKRDRKPWPQVFEAAIERGALIDRQLQSTADKLCAGSLEPLLTHLVRSRLSTSDRKKLRGLLDELEGGA
jgi:predicted transcriptional regulator